MSPLARIALVLLLATVQLPAAFALDNGPATISQQQPDRARRIGLLHIVPDRVSTAFAAFKKKLEQLGYVEGRNIAFEYRWSDQAQRLPALASELTALRVDVIVAGDTTTTSAVKQATKDIPIVAAVFVDDPVASGLVNSLRQPGGNLTGTYLFAPEMSSKRLELLKEIVPELKSVAALWSRQVPNHAVLLSGTGKAARVLGVDVIPVEANSAEDIEAAFHLIAEEHVDAVDVLQAPQFGRIRRKIADFALKYRLPVIAGEDFFVQEGGLVKYGPTVVDCWRQAAVYVDKIVNGAKPADLPVVQPTKFELDINLKTAKALGLTIPTTVLLRADEVVE
jgi:putative ABC transport system substrate-binding protein